MAGDGFLGFQTPTTIDKNLDAEIVVAGSPPLLRERVEIGGAALVEIARVKNATPALADYALVTRPIGLLDASGADVTDGATHAVRVNIVAGAGSGGTALADKSGFLEGTGLFTPVGGVFNETLGSDPTEDQAAALRMTIKRALHVNLRDDVGNRLADVAARAIFAKLTDGVNTGGVNASGALSVILTQPLDNTSALCISDPSTTNKAQVVPDNTAITNALAVFPGLVRSTAPALTAGRAAGLWLFTDGRLIVGQSRILPSSGLALLEADFDFNPAAAADNQVVAGTAAQVITVYGWVVNVFGAATILFRSATNPKFNAAPFATGEKGVFDLRADPWFTCNTAEALNLNSSAVVRISGKVYYTKG